MIRTVTIILLGIFIATCGSEKSEKQPPKKLSRLDSLQQKLLTGWNTWNNPSVSSFVKMPEGLNIQLVLRNKRGGPYWYRDSYITSEKIDFPEKVYPKSHAWDGSYIELEIEWVGQKAKLQSASTNGDIVILYTPVESPDNPHAMLFQTGILWNKKGLLSKKNDHITAVFDNNNLDIFPAGEQTDYDLPVNSPYFSFESDEIAGISTGQPRNLAEIKQIIEQQRQAYFKDMEKYGELSEAYHAMQSVMAWNIFYDAENHRGIASVSRVWNEAWGGYIIFDWDTYFAALMAALDYKELAYSNAIAITNAITDDGFIPNVDASFNVKSRDRSQPPVGGMVCKMIYDKYEEKWFLGEVFDKLLRWNRWWDTNRNNEGYLSWGSDPHPEGMDPHRLKAAKFESGLDNSPLFDEAAFNKEKNMLELASVGLMGLYVADCKYLAEMATILLKEKEKVELLQRAEKYTKKVQELWDEETGIYRDKNLTTGKLSPHLAPTSFYPLIAGIPSQAQAERMIREHFFNPDEFYGQWILPSIARNDSAFSDNSYWRGRIWAPMNFLVYTGLLNYELPQARKELAEKSVALILKEWKENMRVYENYNAVTGVGGDVRNSDSFYSWGGLLALIGLMENGYWENDK